MAHQAALPGPPTPSGSAAGLSRSAAGLPGDLSGLSFCLLSAGASGVCRGIWRNPSLLKFRLDFERSARSVSRASVQHLLSVRECFGLSVRPVTLSLYLLI